MSSNVLYEGVPEPRLPFFVCEDEQQEEEVTARDALKLFSTLDASHRQSVSVHWQLGPQRQFSQEQLRLPFCFVGPDIMFGIGTLLSRSRFNLLFMFRLKSGSTMDIKKYY